mmetsp:Transcript_33623/g.78846  ORF Transcript_33623/g.78846 Transcript_33623/m.78846 type:complete len:277 (+) Transcript_33623:137-967(+)
MNEMLRQFRELSASSGTSTPQSSRSAESPIATRSKPPRPRKGSSMQHVPSFAAAGGGESGGELGGSGNPGERDTGRRNSEGLKRSNSMDNVRLLVRSMSNIAGACTLNHAPKSPAAHRGLQPPPQQEPESGRSTPAVAAGLDAEQLGAIMSKLDAMEMSGARPSVRIRRPSDCGLDMEDRTGGELSPRPHEAPSGYRAWYLLGLGDESRTSLSKNRRGSAPLIGNSPPADTAGASGRSEGGSCTDLGGSRGAPPPGVSAAGDLVPPSVLLRPSKAQ